jgi:hypothetical protein
VEELYNENLLLCPRFLQVGPIAIKLKYFLSLYSAIAGQRKPNTCLCLMNKVRFGQFCPLIEAGKKIPGSFKAPSTLVSINYQER